MYTAVSGILDPIPSPVVVRRTTRMEAGVKAAEDVRCFAVDFETSHMRVLSVEVVREDLDAEVMAWDGRAAISDAVQPVQATKGGCRVDCVTCSGMQSGLASRLTPRSRRRPR